MTEQVAFLSKEKIESLQEKKLQKLLAYLNQHSPFYRKLFCEKGIDIAEIRSLSDMAKLPTTNKEDLQKYNDDFLCVPKDAIVEYTSTSGTLGNPVVIALTEHDLARLAFNEYRSFVTVGATNKDIFQLMLTLDRQFMAGIAYHSGLRKLGAGIIRIGPGVPPLQWETIIKLQPTAIIAVPSFILKLIDYAKNTGIDINRTSVKKAVCIGENIRNQDFSLNILGRKITEAWNIQLYSTYASTEMQTAFTECAEGSGGHHQPDLLIVELLNENNEQVKEGEYGEVTITTLDVEAMPLLRYRTGDISRYIDGPCACGRNTIRLSPIYGRKRQMIKFKGTTLYPPALFELLSEMKEIQDFVVEVYSNEIGLDEVLLHILPAGRPEEIDHRLRAGLQARLRVSPHVRYIPADEIQKMQFVETSRKPVKFIDRRQ